MRPFQSWQGGAGGKWQISTGGGMHTVWSRDGRELFCDTPDYKIMVSEYTAKGDSFTFSKPRGPAPISGCVASTVFRTNLSRSKCWEARQSGTSTKT